jgi:pentapeptide MXKDX repeat protein
LLSWRLLLELGWALKLRQLCHLLNRSTKESMMNKINAVLLSSFILLTAGSAIAKDAMSKDAMAKDAMSKDVTLKDVMSKDAMSKDAITKDAMKKDAMKK